MAKMKVSPEGYAIFRCPGCNGNHRLHVKINGEALLPEPCWDWNGSLDTPTFTPSLRIQWNYGDGDEQCHSNVTEGKIGFHGDSTHALKGQTVDLPEWED